MGVGCTWQGSSPPRREPCWLAVQGSWVTHYAAFVARYSPDGASVLTAAEVEGIPNGVKYLASIYWASTTILTGEHSQGGHPGTHACACLPACLRACLPACSAWQPRGADFAPGAVVQLAMATSFRGRLWRQRCACWCSCWASASLARCSAPLPASSNGPARRRAGEHRVSAASSVAAAVHEQGMHAQSKGQTGTPAGTACRGAALEEKLHSIERYLREHQVSRDVRRSIKRYYADVWVQQQDGLDVAAFYAELPHALRTGEREGGGSRPAAASGGGGAGGGAASGQPKATHTANWPPLIMPQTWPAASWPARCASCTAFGRCRRMPLCCGPSAAAWSRCSCRRVSLCARRGRRRGLAGSCKRVSELRAALPAACGMRRWTAPVGAVTQRQQPCSPLLCAGQVWLSSQGELDSCEDEVLEGPALLGEAALLGPLLGHPCHLHTLRTQTRCKLWRLTSAGFLAALRSRPQVGRWGRLSCTQLALACQGQPLPGAPRLIDVLAATGSCRLWRRSEHSCCMGRLQPMAGLCCPGSSRRAAQMRGICRCLLMHGPGQAARHQNLPWLLAAQQVASKQWRRLMA